MIRILLAMVMMTSPALARTFSTAPQSFCDAVMSHVPDADVNIGADLSGGLDVVSIPVDVDLVRVFGVPVSGAIDLTPTVSTIDIHQDGHVFYDGQDISAKYEDKCGAVAPQVIPPPVKKIRLESDIIEGQYNE